MSFRKFFNNWIVKNILGAVLLVAVLILGAHFLLRTLTKHNQELEVPDLSNMTVAEASATAAQHGMRVQVIDSVYVKRMERGVVFRHNPEAGSHVKKGRRILLTINAVNPKSVTMPNLVGYLQLGKLIYVNDIATNNVLSQLYRNSEIEPGTSIESESVIDLVVGLNSSDNITYIPYVVGTRYLNAVNSIHDNSLNIEKLYFDSTVKDYSDSLDAVVYRQYPELSEEPYRMGASMNLYLTKDMKKVPPRPEPEITID
jgi:beta-lactam-binding protein with PASTA domain